LDHIVLDLILKWINPQLKGKNIQKIKNRKYHKKYLEKQRKLMKICRANEKSKI